MKEHILISRAFRYNDPISVSLPENYVFDEIRGYWTDSVTGEAMMLSKNAKGPQTKKADVETGEDHKGE